LVEAFPRDAKFRADLAETLLVTADVQWDSEDKDSAIQSYLSALEQFETRAKHDSEDVANRRRTAHVQEEIGVRYSQMDNDQAAAACWQNAVNPMDVILDSPFDVKLRESDAAARKRMQKLLDQLSNQGQSVN